jgi:predicted PurR-regulated permease PerM
MGLIEGIIAGIGFFIFDVPGALLLTAVAAIGGIFPIIGTALYGYRLQSIYSYKALL